MRPDWNDKWGMPVDEVTSVKVTQQGDTFHLERHVNLGPALRQCHLERQASHNGFTKGRTMRKIADVPAAVYFAHPELTDPVELKKWLKRHPEYCTVRPGTF